MVRFVLKCGPFRLKTWSVLSLTWSILSCTGPFCPWSVLSMVRYVPNSTVQCRDFVSKPGPLTYESGALPIALRGPAQESHDYGSKIINI